MPRRTLLLVAWMMPGCGGDTKARDTALPDADDTAVEDQTCPAPTPWTQAGCLVRIFDDHDADGRFPEVRTELFDDEGRLVAWDERSPTDWESYAACVRTYDGPRLVEEWCLGQLSYRYEWTFTSDGFPEGKTYDAAYDGVVDKAWFYTTDSAGNIVHEGIDESLNGEADATVDYTVDADGNRTSEQWDYNIDGTVDYASTTTWVDGRATREERDTDGNGSVDGVREWDWDAWGQPVEAREDDNNDGDWDVTTTWIWEDCVPAEILSLETGGRRSVVSLTVDGLGRTVRALHDFDADGHADQDVRTTWDCPGG